MPDLELDVRAKPAPRPPPPKKAKEEEAPLELAVDPRALVQERASDTTQGSSQAHPATMVARGPAAVQAPAERRALAQQPAVGDIAFDAKLLAEYGDPPAHWLLAPLYAWRVFKRQRVLRQVLAGRREEAARATMSMEDALVAFAERVRPAAEGLSGYREALEELSRAEDVLRSRDRVLAAEQDAQTGRLAQVDARISALEAELAQAQSGERAAATELSAAQRGVAREEAKLKRAESELRSAEQRESSGEVGG